MADDLDKAYPPGDPTLYVHWDAMKLSDFRATLKRERDPRGKYAMTPPVVVVTPHERPRRPENKWDYNSSDWTGRGTLGGKGDDKSR